MIKDAFNMFRTFSTMPENELRISYKSNLMPFILGCYIPCNNSYSCIAGYVKLIKMFQKMSFHLFKQLFIMNINMYAVSESELTSNLTL